MSSFPGLGSAIKFLPSLVREGRSNRAIVRTLRDSGIVAGDSHALRAAINITRGGHMATTAAARMFARLRQDGQLRPSLTRQRARFRYHLEYDTIDDLTDEPFKRRISLYADQPQTMEDMLEAMEETFRRNYIDEEPPGPNNTRIVEITVATTNQLY